MNMKLVENVLLQVKQLGVKTLCICPGGRNAPIVDYLSRQPCFQAIYGFEERSAAFFALGRAKRDHAPVAVVTTSGTAVGEVLPAVMEACHSGVPLLVISADRPRRYRGTGAPQSCEQTGIFGRYIRFEQDLAAGEICALSRWDMLGPAHLNVCFEEPLISGEVKPLPHSTHALPRAERAISSEVFQTLNSFLRKTRRPLVVVSGLPQKDREAVIAFLIALNAPVYAEAISGIREDSRLNHIRVKSAQNLWEHSRSAGYPIDAILRIGSVPTLRAWRDLEDMRGEIDVFSLSHLPYSGLSWSSCSAVDLRSFLGLYQPVNNFGRGGYERWLTLEEERQMRLEELFETFPRAEPSLLHSLSQVIPERALIYLGNSLPIREWDLAATRSPRGFDVFANRGLNGIDGQMSTFFGMCRPDSSNWGILGDLTTLYDMSAPWYFHCAEGANVNLVVVNNSGGQIFSRMFPHKEFLNTHQLSFEHLAGFWGLHYHPSEHMSEIEIARTGQLIECLPDACQTERFWGEYAGFKKSCAVLSAN